jgi:hypothetical protein
MKLKGEQHARHSRVATRAIASSPLTGKCQPVPERARASLTKASFQRSLKLGQQWGTASAPRYLVVPYAIALLWQSPPVDNRKAAA